MIWLELGLAVAAGAAMGWVAHALYRMRNADARRTNPIHSRPGPDALGQPAISPPTRTLEGVPATRPPKVSQEADLAARVIVHLSSLGRLGNDEVGRLGHTQKGMTAALGIQQGTLTKVLSRLEAARVVEVDRRHVEGQPIRLKVYRLTALGESVAKDLRRRSPPGPAAAPARESGSN